MGQARDGSVQNLQELYTVAVGAALTLAIVRMVPETSSPVWVSLPVLVAFVVTLVPFYHGAMRHLDLTYQGSSATPTREGALLADFFLLFVEACLFLALASVVTNTKQAAWTLLTLLTLDGVWGIAAHSVFAKSRRSWAEIRWSLINVCTALVIFGFIKWMSVWPWVSQPGRPELSLAVICVARTLADYAWSWRFYFPKK